MLEPENILKEKTVGLCGFITQMNQARININSASHFYNREQLSGDLNSHIRNLEVITIRNSKKGRNE